MRTSIFRLGALIAAALMMSGCGPRPKKSAEAALYRDLDKVVLSRTRTQWLTDEYELSQAEPYALRSVCQADEPTRAGLDAWLTLEIGRQGGPAKAQWARNGHDLEAVAQALHLERVQALLKRARSRADQCPFWISPQPNFAGVEAPGGGRFAMLLETQGGLTFTRSDKTVAVGGGGGLRAMPAYALDEGWMVATGVEIGGGTLLPKDEDGEGRRLRARWEFTVPVLMRYQSGVFYWDTEAALINRAPENDPEAFRTGGRVATGVGFSSLRIGELMPYAGFWVGYEYLEASAEEQLSPHALRLGTKVGVDWAF